MALIPPKYDSLRRKRCAECGSAAEDDAVRCAACGGTAWRVPDLYYVRAVIIAGGLMALLAVVLWVLWQRW